MIDSKLIPTVDLFIERLTGLGEEYGRAEAAAVEAEAFAAARRERMAQIGAEATKLQEASAVLGFDLFAENQRRWELAQDGSPNPEDGRPTIPPPTPSVKAIKIKDWVLEAAKAAYPEPVLAAALRQELRAMGHDIHDKTIGMTLYRWTRKGQIRRDGLKWFWVPEDDQLKLEGLST